ncbi:glycosyltransferase [Actinokineospora diospyrosa]|uniref:UDP-glucoronosyl and UDP-glucosyl transferase n=1 Tax=Actinokineospora diospyrosa TaxID=103728 RepID=A0ABT1IBX4_9PSEU|nr:nucleotide disphospho-sugar-binding domain-containing protein [Actinokineospora diospyrosa]MCP2270066.1 UDP-glucoronosyl and UDP-glucosyl transferase [Actinokineospora diospyrosa]
MSRLLFVVPPLAGHVNPLAGVAAAAVERGHEVAWVGPCPVVRDLVGGRVYPAGSYVERRPPGLRAYAALRFLWAEFLVPLADAMVPGVRAAVADFDPDVLVVDQQAFAGALVAQEVGLPWVTSASTSAELADPLAGLPRVAEWVREQQRGLRMRHGVEGDDDLRFSPYSVVVFSTVELAGEPAVAVADPHFVGPSLAARRPVEFPWARLRPNAQLVLVTLGTTNSEAGGRFLAECALALSTLSKGPDLVVHSDQPKNSSAWKNSDLSENSAEPRHSDLSTASGGLKVAGALKGSRSPGYISSPVDFSPPKFSGLSMDTGAFKDSGLTGDSSPPVGSSPWRHSGLSTDFGEIQDRGPVQDAGLPERLSPQKGPNSPGGVGGPKGSGRGEDLDSSVVAGFPDLQGVVVDPGGCLSAGGDVVVVASAPVLDLLPYAAVVVCHGGHNTVCEALAHGVPLVVAPIRDDQPVLADQVVAAGAGVRLRFDHARAADIAAAVRAVVTEPVFAMAARRVRGSFERAGGARAVVAHLEELASGAEVVRPTSRW